MAQYSKLYNNFALNILWFPSDYSTFTSCYYCSQSPHQTENFLTTTLRKNVELTATLKGVYYLLSLTYCHVIIIHFFISILVLLFNLLETQLHCKYIQFKCSECVVKKPENCNSPAYFPFNELHTRSGSTLEN